MGKISTLASKCNKLTLEASLLPRMYLGFLEGIVNNIFMDAIMI